MHLHGGQPGFDLADFIAAVDGDAVVQPPFGNMVQHAGNPRHALAGGPAARQQAQRHAQAQRQRQPVAPLAMLNRQRQQQQVEHRDGGQVHLGVGQRRQATLARQLAVAAQPGVQRLGRADVGAAGGGAHRHIAGGLAILFDRHDKSRHPVVVAIFTAVFHHAFPGVSVFEREPHVFENTGRHVRVAQDILAGANQFVALKAGYLDKGVIGVSDHPLEVGLGDDGAVGKRLFMLGDGQIEFHVWSLSRNHQSVADGGVGMNQI